MKVFISWSGEISHEIACIFRDWLPSVIQSIKPYVSSQDIDKGTRWSSDIASELEVSNYGIIIITKDNLNAPWINFEAGALSKALDKSNVSPFLFNIKRSEVQGPLLQFQSTIFEKGEVLKLLQSVNNRFEADKQLDKTQLSKSFEIWWNELETKLKAIKDDKLEENSVGDNSKVSQSEILEEILELVRNQQRILNSPEKLLPRNYFEKVVDAIYENDTLFLHKILNKHRELWIMINEMKGSIDGLLSNRSQLGLTIPLLVKLWNK